MKKSTSELGKGREAFVPCDQLTLPLFSSFVNGSDTVDIGAIEESNVASEDYFPTRRSEIMHRLWYVLTYPI